MKKTLTAVVLVITMLISSAAAGFAGTRLSRPVIEEIDAGKKQHQNRLELYRTFRWV